MSQTYSHPSQSTAASRKQPQFHEIQVRSLKLDSTLPFAIYTQIEGEYILYRREGLPFTRVQQTALIENNIRTAFIASEHLDVFWQYLKGSIFDLVDGGGLPLKDRATLFYQTSTELTKNALSGPFNATNVGTANTVVKSSLRLLEEGKAALHTLMLEMETQPGLFQSSLNCCQYALALAQQMGITDQYELEAFGMGVLFMDLGMLQLPNGLHAKEGPLSFDEWGMMKRHPALGLEMIADLKGVSDLTKAVVIGHHERLDGSGYPQGLHGSELTLALCIIHIVEHFNHLTAHPDAHYRVTPMKALHTMKVDLSAGFDQEILNAFIRLIGTAEK